MSIGKRYKLVAFDVDGTLVGNPDRKVVWELFNRHFCATGGPGDPRFVAYQERQITYAEWVEQDVQGWLFAGATRLQMTAIIRANLHLVPGAEQAIGELHRRGYRLVVISGTLDLTLEVLLPEHPFEEVHTNRLYFDARGRIQDWRATAYDMEGKAEALRRIAKRMGIALSETAFVGDNVNDIHAMDHAGLAIAYEPKARAVRDVADAEITGDLRGVLQILPEP